MAALKLFIRLRGAATAALPGDEWAKTTQQEHQQPTLNLSRQLVKRREMQMLNKGVIYLRAYRQAARVMARSAINDQFNDA